MARNLDNQKARRIARQQVRTYAATSSHTHAQADVTSLTTDLGNKQATSAKDQASGYAGLNSASRITKGAITTDDIIINLATKGLVLKDTDGHYWRVTVTTLGALTISDLGTSAP